MKIWVKTFWSHHWILRWMMLSCTHSCRHWHLCADVWVHFEDISEGDYLDGTTGCDLCPHLLHGFQPVHPSLCPFTVCQPLYIHLEDNDNGYWRAWLWWYLPSVYLWSNVQWSRRPLPCNLLHNVGHLSHSYANPLHKLVGEFDLVCRVNQENNICDLQIHKLFLSV